MSTRTCVSGEISRLSFTSYKCFLFIISRESHDKLALFLMATHFADGNTETWVKSLVQGPLANEDGPGTKPSASLLLVLDIDQ